MSLIQISDPLNLIGRAGGKILTPAQEYGARAVSALDVDQKFLSVGEPVPVVFGLRDGNYGGVFISPGASEARYTNSLTNVVTAYYHLVISDGEIGDIQVRDVFQRACRTGSHIKAYGKRAGTWLPGNNIVDRGGSYQLPVAPGYCGSVGYYTGMTTMSYSATHPDGSQLFMRQVHVFIRNGLKVTRLRDNTYASSDSFADLYKWLLERCGRVPSDLIDTDALEVADLFLRYNNFTCNCYLAQSSNMADFTAKWAPYFFLIPTNRNGKRGLRPLLPINEATGQLSQNFADVKWQFTEESIITDSVEIFYYGAAERKPVVVQVMWRQQLTDEPGIVRTSEVRFAGTAPDGPYESYDLSEFCTREDHAVKVGAYILAKRAYTQHSIRFTLAPGDYSTLEPGDIVRVCLSRYASDSAAGFHDFLYQIEQISNNLVGDTVLECTHFPIDENGVSILAKAVSSTSGYGYLFSSQKTGPTCDVNSSGDTGTGGSGSLDVDWNVDGQNPWDDSANPWEDGVLELPDAGAPAIEVGGLDGGGIGSSFGGGSDGKMSDDRPEDGSTDGDPANTGMPGSGGGGLGSNPGVGDTVDSGGGDGTGGCQRYIVWYTLDDNGKPSLVKYVDPTQPSSTYTIQATDQGKQLYSDVVEVCDDDEPTVETTDHGKVNPPNPWTTYKWFRWNGEQEVRPVGGGRVTSALGGATWYSTTTYFGAISKKSELTRWATSMTAMVGDYVPEGCVATFDPTPVIATISSSYIVFTYAGSQATGCCGNTYYGTDCFLKKVSGSWQFSNDKVNVASTYSG